MAKYQEICEILTTRIRHGEYPGNQLPNLRRLAEDMGVSYLTARQAVNLLKTQGILASDSSGRKTLVNVEPGLRPRVALLTPFWHVSEWHLAIRRVVLELGGQLKVFACTTSTDTTIDEALGGNFDLIFIQLPETPPPRLLERMSKCCDRIVTMFQDYTAYGIRSLQGAKLSSVDAMMQKLFDRGHRSVDYIQILSSAYSRDLTLRHQHWQSFLDAHGMQGRAHTRSVPDYSEKQFYAVELCRDLLARYPLPDAFFCATVPVAVGMYRACFEAGIRVGRDVSVFSFGGTQEAQLMTPALATIRNPGVEEMIRELVLQYCPGGHRSERLLYQSEAIELFEGESLMERVIK